MYRSTTLRERCHAWFDKKRTVLSRLGFLEAHARSKRFLKIAEVPEKAAQSKQRLNENILIRTRESLERLLTKNIIPFWYPEVIDRQHGGYRLNHDLEGRWQGPANKSLVTQARTVWFFSRLVNSKYRNREFLEAARHGYAFLRERMWDKEFGGFYWEIDSSGNTATAPEKRTYGQAFGLYALTEYGMASRDSAATTTAKQLFDLIETHAHDAIYGGYREVFQRDWSPIVSATQKFSRIKRMNTHMHLLEALTAFRAVTHEPVAQTRLLELIFINSNSVVRKNVGACTDRYLETWEPLLRGKDGRVSYGHDVENIWLLIEACKSAGVYENLLMDLYRAIFHYALNHGFDWRHGGFYDSGRLHAPADRREKIWWTQAEGLVAALKMYRLTGEEIYWNCFSRTLEWVVNHQADWRRGDWYAKVSRDETVAGVKAGPWKSPYHNGRAMLECLELLAEAPNEPGV